MMPVDPKLLAGLRARAKQQIRQRMRALRSSLPEAARAARSEAVCRRVLELSPFARARAVALFAPILKRGEIDVSSLDAALRDAGKTVYYPFMDAVPGTNRLRTGFRRVDRREQLEDRGRGFLEPDPGAAVAERGAIDVVLVPALAVGATGHRIGYGAGFYDATLPDVRPPAIGVVVAYGFQLLAELPVEDNDVACDLVVTDQHLLDPGGVLG